jgi:Flp pilus assembly protein TadG
MFNTSSYRPALTRLAADRRGVTAIVTAIALTALLGFAGLAIDVAYWLNATRGMQAAADQAAYAAAGTAGTNGCPYAAATTQASAIAAARGYNNGVNNTTVTTNCPSTTTFRVVISQVQPMWFASLFMSSAPTASAEATAQLAGTVSDLCILALDGTNLSEGVVGSDASAFWLNGGTNVAIKCGVAVDSSNAAALSAGGSASVTATNIYMVGSFTGGGSATIATSPTPNNIKSNQVAVPDPYANRVVPDYTCGSYGGSTQITSGTLHATDHSSGASSGTFCGGLSIGGNSPTTINIDPGVYVVAGSGGLSFSSKATVIGTGVTFVLTGDTAHGYATITLNGGPQSNVNLTAPTSGPYGGLVFFQDRNAPTASGGNSTSCGSGSGKNQINGGSNQVITGAIYFPSQSLCFNGGSSSVNANKCTQLIAYNLAFTGSSDIESTCTGVGISPLSVLTPTLIR